MSGGQTDTTVLVFCLDVLLNGRHHQIGSPVRADQARAYVKSLLERLTGSEKVVTDDDGDYRFSSGTATTTFV